MLVFKSHRIAFDEYEKMHAVFPDSEFFNGVINFLQLWNDPRHESFEFKTSGSTGTPKLIEHKRSSIQQSIAKTKAYFKLKEGDKALLAMPVAFVAGNLMLARAVEIGIDLYLCKPGLNPFRCAPDTSFDFVPLTPMQFENALETNPEAIERCKSILLGGAPVSHTLAKQINAIDTPVYLGYGMTETLTHIAVRSLNGPAFLRILYRP